MLNKVIIITSYAIICVSRHRGYQDNTRITVPPPGHHKHVWLLPLLITSDTQVKCGPAPGNQRRKGGAVIHYNCFILMFILDSLKNPLYSTSVNVH